MAKGKKQEDEKKSKYKSSKIDDAKANSPAPEAVNVEEEQKEVVEYTETSFTSASLETMPSLISGQELAKKKKKKKKEIGALKSDKSLYASDTHHMISSDTHEVSVGSYDVKKTKGKGKQKKGKAGKGGKGKDLKDDEIPFEKPPKWGKMSKRERDEWMLQEFMRRKMENEVQKKEKLERRNYEARMREEVIKEEASKQDVRRDILAKTCTLFRRNEQLYQEIELRSLARNEWKTYIKCDGLPDPKMPQQLNVYIRRWRDRTYRDCTEIELCKRFQDCQATLELINTALSRSWTMPPETVKNIMEARLELRSLLLQEFECNSYNLLRDIDKNLKILSTRVATYHKEVKDLKLQIYVALRYPTRLPRPVDPESPEKEPTTLKFKELQLQVTLPPDINGSDVSVRVARNLLDLYSPLSRTNEMPQEMPHDDEDMFTYSIKEFEYAKKIKVENEKTIALFYKTTKDKIKELERFIKHNYGKSEKEKARLDMLQLAEPPELLGKVYPFERIRQENEDELKEFLLLNRALVDIGEVNLRKYRVIGGVLNLDFFETPPQCKYILHGVYLSTLTLPKKLRPINYRVEYTPIYNLGSADLRKSRNMDAIIMEQDKARERLVIVEMMLPKNAIWFEPPVVCQWNEHRRYWTTEGVFEVEYDDIDSTIKFRISRLWPIGLATARYSNLPYRDWELTMDPIGKGVLFKLRGAFINMTILCRHRNVVIREITFRKIPMEFTYINQFVNRKINVKKLKLIMQEIGIDIFPDFDAHNYIQNSCIKNWVIEKHLYHAMAFLSHGYGFKRSRWNHRVGVRNIVIQMREQVDLKREYKYELLFANPEYCTYLKNREDTKEFSSEPAVGMSFFPDLFTFNMSYGSSEAKRRSFNMNFKLTETIFELLKAIKPCSFS